MSEKYVTPPVISFEAIFEQSNPFSPIIFILSPGSDPASDLMKLAERSGFGGNKLKFLAMGQGQEKVENRVLFRKKGINYCVNKKKCEHFYLTSMIKPQEE